VKRTINRFVTYSSVFCLRDDLKLDVPWALWFLFQIVLALGTPFYSEQAGGNEGTIRKSSTPNFWEALRTLYINSILSTHEQNILRALILSDFSHVHPVRNSSHADTLAIALVLRVQPLEIGTT